jgi:hypothetical protein
MVVSKKNGWILCLPNSFSFLRGVFSSSSNSFRGSRSACYSIVAEPIILSQCSCISILADIAGR